MGSKLKLFKCKNSKTDCVKRTEEGRCNILNNTEFKDKEGNKIDCPFYKPREERKA